MFALVLASCGGARPESLGVKEARLGDCPESPNCVSSQASDDEHRVAPFRLVAYSDASWAAVQERVAALPRTTIVTASENYLHAECRSRLLRFVDDLELYLRPEDALVEVRSASRVGYSDLGVNRRRVETLGEALREAGLIE